MKIDKIQQQKLLFVTDGKAEKNELVVPEVELTFNARTARKFNAQVTNSMEVSNFIRSLYPKGKIELQEQFVILFLNRKLGVIGYYRHTIGTHSATLVDDNIILSAAIKSLSSGVIISHNHPSGNTSPSQEDRKLTNRLIKQFEPFSIKVFDHLIITKDSYYSFADEGTLNGLSGLVESKDDVMLVKDGIPYLTEEEEKELGIEGEYLLGRTKGRDAIYQMVNDKILAIIKGGGELFWRKTWIDQEVTDESDSAPKSFGRSFGSGKLYSGINFWAVNVYPIYDTKGELTYQLSKTDQPFWLTPKQIRELGGKVNKEAKRATIVYYIKQFSSLGKGISSELYWQIMKECNENPDDKRCEGLKAYSAMKYYSVFNQKDVSGIDFEKKAPKIKFQKPLNKDEKIQASELLVEHMPNAPKINYGGSRAFYSINTDSVHVPKQGQFESINEFYGTLFHELSHSTGHKSRLAREFGAKGTKEYAFEELVAELSASYLNAESGILFETLRNSSAYIKGWHNRLIKEMEEDYKFFFKASALAQKASNYILNVDDKGIPEFYKYLGKGKQNNNKNKKAIALSLKAKAVKLKLKLLSI